MNWQPVESSQIAEVGYDQDAELLGIRFKKDGVPGPHWYQYANVPARLHRAMMAAKSVGVYFKDNVKSHSDIYPYEKIEDAVPTLPFRTEISTKTASMEGTISTVSTGGATTSSALAKVDTLKESEIFVPGTLDPLLIEIREEVVRQAKDLDISTEAKRRALKALAFKVVKSRTFIEGLHKSYTQTEKKRLATVDAEKRRVCEILQGIEDEVRRPLTDWENANEERIQKHTDAIKSIEAMQPHIYPDILSLEAAVKLLTELDTDTFEEFSVPAYKAKEQVLTVLIEELEKRQRAEDGRRELEALRAELTARQEQERLANAAREAREQAEREAQERERKAAAEAEAERVRIEGERAAAEQRAKDAEERERLAAEQAVRDQAAAVEAERKRIADEQAKADAVRVTRQRDAYHRGEVNREVVNALIQVNDVTPEIAVNLVEAISNGLIPHVTINY